MYIIKNAIKSITGNKGRNVLICIVITIIATACAVSLSIKNSADKLIDSYKNSTEVTGNLVLDRDAMRGDMKQNGSNANDFMSQIPKLDVNMIKKYGDSQYVKRYEYYQTTQVNSSNLEKITSFMNGTVTSVDSIGGKVPNSDSKKVTGDFNLVGYGSLESMSEFVNSNYKITSGSMFDINDNTNPCVISNELAEENNLSVGDEIILTNPNNEKETYKFKITGIYEDNTNDGSFSMFSNSANKIITNYVSLNNVVSNSDSENKLEVQTNSTFILSSQNVVERFTEELYEKGLSNYYTLYTNLDSINEIVKPIENLANFANIFLIVVLAIGGVVLVVINMINIRERKYEIGVLRAIGMKKQKVLLQFVIETFIVTFISIMLGTGIGACISVPVANSLLSNEITSIQENANQVNDNFGFTNGSGSGKQMQIMNNVGGDIRQQFGNDVSYTDKLNAIIDIKTILQLILIGVVLTIVSSSVSMVFISRYSPLKILSNRT